MPKIPIDLAPEQILHWLKTELSARPGAFELRAERDFVAAENLDKGNAGISADTDVTSVSAVGRLDLRPSGPNADWVLQMRTEDQLGDHLPEGRSVDDQPEEIGLETFEELFLTPPIRAMIETVLVAETAEAASRAAALFASIRTDRHAP